MKATQLLTREHDVIKRAIKILTAADERLRNGDDDVAEVYPQVIDFIRTFADECHHGKEEDVLFKVLSATGMPMTEGPLAVMLAEHDEGRRYVKDMADAAAAFLGGDRSARLIVTENGDKYANLLDAHIDKENGILYPMADRILTPQDQDALADEFDQVEERLGPGLHEKYEAMISRLERELKVA